MYYNFCPKIVDILEILKELKNNTGQKIYIKQKEQMLRCMLKKEF